MALDIEPQLTKWDTVSGLSRSRRRRLKRDRLLAMEVCLFSHECTLSKPDADCGETVASGAKAVLAELEGGLGSDGDVVRVLKVLTETTDGKSSALIYTIAID
jgi:hypothetical protein